MHKLITMAPLHLAGMNFYGDPFSQKGGWSTDNEIGRTWERFMAYGESAPLRLSCNEPGVLYEVHLHTEETPKTGVFEVFVGESSLWEPVSFKLVTKDLPGGEYLVLTLTGDQITGDWEPVALEAARQVGKTLDPRYVILRYDHRFKGMDKLAESELDVLIPVV